MKGALGGLTMLVEMRVVGEGEGGVEGTKTETVGEGGDGGVFFVVGFRIWVFPVGLALLGHNGCFVH